MRGLTRRGFFGALLGAVAGVSALARRASGEVPTPRDAVDETGAFAQQTVANDVTHFDVGPEVPLGRQFSGLEAWLPDDRHAFGLDRLPNGGHWGSAGLEVVADARVPHSQAWYEPDDRRLTLSPACRIELVEEMLDRGLIDATQARALLDAHIKGIA